MEGKYKDGRKLHYSRVGRQGRSGGGTALSLPVLCPLQTLPNPEVHNINYQYRNIEKVSMGKVVPCTGLYLKGSNF